MHMSNAISSRDFETKVRGTNLVICYRRGVVSLVVVPTRLRSPGFSSAFAANRPPAKWIQYGNKSPEAL